MTEVDLELWCHGVAKAGSRADEWEDSAAFSSSRRRFAVADGATTAFRAAAWSDLLTAGWLCAPRADDEVGWQEWLDLTARTWRGQVDDRQEVPYYVRAAADRGSFATFLGVEVDEGNDRDPPRWRAVAVGDACLFHVRGHELLRSFPVSDPRAFGSHPVLIHTGTLAGEASARGVERADGALDDDDDLLLATDALAEWVLRRSIDDSAVWDMLRRLDGPGLEGLVAEQRRSGDLTNDDVALLRCHVRVGAAS